MESGRGRIYFPEAHKEHTKRTQRTQLVFLHTCSRAHYPLGPLGHLDFPRCREFSTTRTSLPSLPVWRNFPDGDSLPPWANKPFPWARILLDGSAFRAGLMSHFPWFSRSREFSLTG